MFMFSAFSSWILRYLPPVDDGYQTRERVRVAGGANVPARRGQMRLWGLCMKGSTWRAQRPELLPSHVVTITA